MPLYEFICGDCSTQFESIQSFSATTQPNCPACQSSNVARQLSKPAIHFKGSGWYITDSKNSGKQSANGAPKNGDNSGDKSTNGDSSAKDSATSEGASKPAASSESNASSASTESSSKSSEKSAAPAASA